MTNTCKLSILMKVTYRLSIVAQNPNDFSFEEIQNILKMRYNLKGP